MYVRSNSTQYPQKVPPIKPSWHVYIPQTWIDKDDKCYNPYKVFSIIGEDGREIFIQICYKFLNALDNQWELYASYDPLLLPELKDYLTKFW